MICHGTSPTPNGLTARPLFSGIRREATNSSRPSGCTSEVHIHGPTAAKAMHKSWEVDLQEEHIRFHACALITESLGTGETRLHSACDVLQEKHLVG